jgi:cellulose synthase/poly-beta-1,6-N-acetylglucosamine synthase-like glycosyltransferase
MIDTLITALVFGCAVCVLLVFAGYPLFLVVRNRFFSLGGSELLSEASSPPYSFSLIVVFHNGGALLRDKIRNFKNLEPSGYFREMILFSDGSDDDSLAVVRSAENPEIRVLHCDTQTGKFNGLNEAAASAWGEILVFSDLDALVEPGAVNALLRHFQNPDIGGVCGQRVIGRDGTTLVTGQKRYVGLDSWIKLQESRFGSITSNDGKLYAIRRSLFRQVDPCATDDLYTCLNVVKQGARFVYEPTAKAVIRVPSRSPGHELTRRRRVVTRSLHGIFSTGLLNPFRYGFYAVGLFINKVMRRFLPVFLAGLFLGSLLQARSSAGMGVLFSGQCLFYMTAAAYPVLTRVAAKGVFRKLTGLASSVAYFCIGMYGTGLGLFDYLRGKRVAFWIPVKGDR